MLQTYSSPEATWGGQEEKFKSLQGGVLFKSAYCKQWKIKYQDRRQGARPIHQTTSC